MRAKQTLGVVLPFLAIFAWVLLRTPTPLQLISDGDWGQQLGGVPMIFHGEHPFVDFPCTYGPLTFYASAWAQAIFGHCPLVEILLTVTGFALGYSAFLSFGKRLYKSDWVALIVVLVLLLLLPRSYKYFIILGPGLVAYCLYAWRTEPSIKGLWKLAAAVVLTGYYRSDFGTYSVIATMIAIALLEVPLSERLIVGAKWLGMLAALGSPYLVWLASRGALGTYLENSFRDASIQARVFRLPLPTYMPAQWPLSGNNSMFLMYLVLGLAPSATLAVAWIKRKELGETTFRAIVPMAILAQLSFMQSLTRPGFGHLIQATPITTLLVCWIVLQLPGRGRILTAGVLVAICLGAAIGNSNLPRFNLFAVGSDLAELSLAPQQVVSEELKAHPAEPNLLCVQYFIEHTKPNDYVAAYPYADGFQYFADRRFAGAQQVLAPGYFSSPKDQKRLVRLLAKQRALIADVPDFAWDDMPERRTIVFERLYRRFVDSHYQTVAKIGPFNILQPK